MRDPSCAANLSLCVAVVSLWPRIRVEPLCSENPVSAVFFFNIGNFLDHLKSRQVKTRQHRKNSMATLFALLLMSRSARETARQAFRISQVNVMDQARLAISHLGFACCIQVFNLLNVISCGNFVRSSMPIFVWARISFAEQWETSIAFSMVRVCAN